LNACCRIAEEHGGRILTQSVPDGYTAFRLELPIADKSTDPLSYAAVAPRMAAGTGN